jgi:ribonuclease III
MYRKIYKNKSDMVIHNGHEQLLIPFNPANRLIMPYDIECIIKKFGETIEVRDIRYYREALTHKSYVDKPDYQDPNILEEYNDIIRKSIPLQPKSNERLEFLGDTFIKSIFSDYLFKRFPNDSEGYMTRLKMTMECRDSLAMLAKRIGLDKFLILSIQIEESSGRTSDKLLEDCFESFIGALELDQGFELVKKVLTNLLENDFDFAGLLYNDKNYKDAIMRFYHSCKWSHPKYIELDHAGPTNMRIFRAGVKDNDGNIIARGTGGTKKAAEQAAAKKALIHFHQLNQDQILEEDDTMY